MSEKTTEVINLSKTLCQFSDFWHPRIVGELNDSHIKLAKLQGEFIWHHHETEDEMFLVLKGTLVIKLRERDLILQEGELVIIPHEVEHMPVAENEVHVLLFEPKSTVNTGNVTDANTINADWI